MEKEEDKLTYDDFVETHQIDNYEHLLDIIDVGNDKDIRENFIFRGLKKTSYDLIPSALRYDEEIEEWDINKFIIESEFNFHITRKQEILVGGETKTGVSFDIVNKSNQSVDADSKYGTSEGAMQFKREAYVLLSFLNYADKIGLKIPTSTYVRRRIHNRLSYLPKEKYRWPEPDFYEIISLAQHYGLPTRALDWSYDFKVALYFAVEDILENNTEDCVLWAFNYKLFEDNYHPHTDVTPTNEIEEVIIYRPAYNNNSNLRGQKGLFTFLTSAINESNERYAFDDILVNGLIGRRHPEEYDENLVYYYIGGYEKFQIEKNEKVFHKFIISGDLKARILNDLYKDGYAPENIYPSFQGVVDSIEKRARLDNIINKEE